jgi:hypothetical protein
MTNVDCAYIVCSWIVHELEDMGFLRCKKVITEFWENMTLENVTKVLEKIVESSGD